ncbi:hypothetical protein LRAMOSA03625 [Lichtheimia ramosa]|uniref:Nucleotide exchange factor Fes1 domain-containing protein n=1 Tax=Lichtheimia ramosa TaxID=688394 RepID=A0A077WX15_9FUNG|nr:hypothetical protein LRAMOSA03625 [Lichtheimia ramosa]
MEKLLQWAVNNSDREELQKQAEAVRKGEVKPDPSKFDPKIIEAILGKDDATRMKEAVECIANTNDTLENREIALDNLELLIEGIDNANNIEAMNLWPALLGQLTAPEPEIRKGVAWVCGTAVQNNPKAQTAFITHKGLDALLDLLKTEQDKQVKGKLIYALSGVLKHSPPAIDAFLDKDGLPVLCDILKLADDPAMLRKVVFMFNSLMIDNAKFGEALLKTDIWTYLNNVLDKYPEDEDMAEKVLRTAHTLLKQANGNVPADFKTRAKKAAETFGKEHLGLVDEEWNELLA